MLVNIGISSAFAESAKNSKSPTPQGGVAPRKLGSLNNVAKKHNPVEDEMYEKNKFEDNDEEEDDINQQEEDVLEEDEDEEDEEVHNKGQVNKNKPHPNKSSKPVENEAHGENNFRMAINPEEYAYNANLYYQQYQENKNKNVQPKLVSQTNENGKMQKVYADGKKEVVFKNGAKREIFPNGYIIVNYRIGDVKQTLPDNSIIYYYSDADTTQITLPDNGLNVAFVLIRFTGSLTTRWSSTTKTDRRR